MEHKDMMGSEIKVGDIIVYAAMYGQSPCLRMGKVMKTTVSSTNSKTLTLKVQGMSRSYDGEWTPLSKLSTLRCLDRILVLDKNLTTLLMFM